MPTEVFLEMIKLRRMSAYKSGWHHPTGWEAESNKSGQRAQEFFLFRGHQEVNSSVLPHH